MSLPPPTDRYVGEPGYPDPWATTAPREGLRDTDHARIVSLSPDVCRTPIGSSTPPIPYPVVDFCGHDENYTGTVRFTGQKAMVFRSNTSHVHGDEPGTAKGMKSGTVGARCHPIGHAAQVRAEGSNVIRHLDRFHMNDRNTEGEAIFVRDTATYAALKDDDPVKGSLVQSGRGVPIDGVAQSYGFPASQALGPPVRLAQAGGLTATDAPMGRAPALPKVNPVDGLKRLGIWGKALSFLIEQDAAIKDSIWMKPAENTAERRAWDVLTSPLSKSVIAGRQLLGGQQTTTVDNILSGKAFDFSSKYGMTLDPDERIPMANDILGALTGRPQDVRTMTDEEVATILQQAQASDQAGASDKAVAGSNVRVTPKQACDDLCKLACECMADRGGAATYTECVARKLREQNYDPASTRPDGTPRYPKSPNADGPRPEVSYDPANGYSPRMSKTNPEMPSSGPVFKGMPRPDVSWWLDGRLGKIIELKFPRPGGGVDGQTEMQADGEYENIARQNGLDPDKDLIELDISKHCDCSTGKSTPSAPC